MQSPLVLTERGVELVAQFTCPSRKISKVLHFIIDTGSGLSFIGWKDALQAGIDWEKLGRYAKPVAGFGGAADARHLNEPCFIHLDFEDEQHQHSLVTVDLLDGMLVYRPARTKTKHWKVEDSVSLLGRDFLASTACTLVLNLAEGEGWFER